MAKKTNCYIQQIDLPNILIEVPKLAKKYSINETVAWGIFNKTPGCYPDPNRLDLLETELKKIKGETI